MPNYLSKGIVICTSHKETCCRDIISSDKYPFECATFQLALTVTYTLFQNGRHFTILLFTCKLALVASFKGKYSLNFEFKSEAIRANLQENKRILKWRPFWNKVYAL